LTREAATNKGDPDATNRLMFGVLMGGENGWRCPDHQKNQQRKGKGKERLFFTDHRNLVHQDKN